jgi:hypothetical protein
MSTVAASLAHRHSRLDHVEPALVALLRQLDPLLVVPAVFQRLVSRVTGARLLPRDRWL